MCLLLEGVQHLNGVWERCDINDPKRTRLILDPNFPDAGTNGFHWFPIVWIQAALHMIELKTCFTPCSSRKLLKVLS
jgi:hypothetical protein